MGWRADVRDNYVTTLKAFQAANPTLVEHVARSRQEAIVDKRCAFVGPIAEQIRLDSGTWQRPLTVDIIVTRHLADNEEVIDNLEDIADTLIDWLAANDRAHVLGAHTEQHPTGSREIELSDGGTFIPAIAITCLATIQQGRT